MELISQILPNILAFDKGQHQGNSYSSMSAACIDSLQKTPTIRPKINPARNSGIKNTNFGCQKHLLEQIKSKSTLTSSVLISSLKLIQQQTQQIANINDCPIDKFEQSLMNDDFLSLCKNETGNNGFIDKFSLLANEIKQVKYFIKMQIRQKVKEMHRIFSEGNKKSIQLVMMIVKQLQKENSVLRQMMQAKNKQGNSAYCNCSNKVIKFTEVSAQKPSHVENLFQAQSPKQEDIQKIHRDKSFVKNLDVQQATQQQQQLSPINKIQEHSQSILLINQHLETIQEIENDDEEYSIKNDQNKSSRNTNTYSPQSKRKKNQASLIISSFNEEFLCIEINPKRKNGGQLNIMSKLLKLKQSSTQRTNKNQLQINPIQAAVSYNKENERIIKQEYFEQNQKREKQSVEQFDIAEGGRQMSGEVQGERAETIQYDSCGLAFNGICLEPEDQSEQSISEALSILKQYSLHDNDVLNESTRINEPQTARCEPIRVQKECNFVGKQLNTTKSEVNSTRNSMQRKKELIKMKPEISVAHFDQRMKENIIEQRPQAKQNRIKNIMARSPKNSSSNSLIYSKIKSFFPAQNTVYEQYPLHQKRPY